MEERQKRVPRYTVFPSGHSSKY